MKKVKVYKYLGEMINEKGTVCSTIEKSDEDVRYQKS